MTKTLATKGAAAETAPRANARARETIVAEIHALVGTKYFDIGDRLIELRDCCEPGEWRNALKHEFAWSEDTAARYMASARLAFRVRTVRNLKVPPTIIYDLAQNHADDDDLPAIIEALGQGIEAQDAAKGPVPRCDLHHPSALQIWRFTRGDIEGDK